MNWFKRNFGKRNWETIYSFNVVGYSALFGIPVRNVKLRCIIQLDKERNKVRGYLTDGEMKSFHNIDYFLINYPEIKNILDKHNIKY